MNTRKTVFCALGLCVAMVLSYVESVLPLSIGIPGAKLGLPNLVTVVILYIYGILPAMLISILRIFLSGFMFGNMFSIIYSLGGFILSFISMVLLKKTGLFGVLAVSSAGGTAHNLGQLLVAGFVLSNYVFFYLPILLAAGIISGLLIGVISWLMLRRLEKILPKG